jgi:hypothetical protein
LSTPDWLEAAKTVLTDLGYKLHAPLTHDEFATRFPQLQYQVLITELLFAAASPEENASLRNLQRMPMSVRRHVVVILIGHEYETLNQMQAFQQSVHAVVNPRDMRNLPQIIQHVVSENDLRLAIYRGIQLEMAQGKL